MLKIINPGVYSSLQDNGRFGSRSFGVPVSGAMDQSALELANKLVGNSPNEAVLEFILQGPLIEFRKPTLFVITGCEIQAKLNAKLIKRNQVHNASQGDILSLERIISGLCGYLAVKNGFDVPKILGSKSFYAPITSQSYLRKNDEINILSSENNSEGVKIEYHNDTISESDRFEMIKGPEYEYFSPEQLAYFFSNKFELSHQLSRMGFRTASYPILGNTEIITSAVQPGTIQVTPAGQLIILMRDAPTTGGYARIGQLTKDSINRFAQCRPGETVQFSL